MNNLLIAGLAAASLVLAPVSNAEPPGDQPGVSSCVDDAPRVCGPDNTLGAPAGCYDDGGVLEFAWPCTPWEPNMGYQHPDGTITYPNGDIGTQDGEILVSGKGHDAGNHKPLHHRSRHRV